MPHRKIWFPALLFLLSAVLTGSLTASRSDPAYARSGLKSSRQPQLQALQPEVRYAERQDTSPPLRELISSIPAFGGDFQVAPRLALPHADSSAPPAADPLLPLQLAAWPESSLMPAVQFSFGGTGNVNRVLPPDPNGDVGPEHYVQWVNLSLSIWRLDRAARSAALVYGPEPGNTIWSGFGGPCEETNHGDPIVQYDHLAGRWMISQFSVGVSFYQCIAVSQTGDPTGPWHRYAFLFSDDRMNDYPKFGVWPDGYYMSVNQFIGFAYAGAGAVVFEREKMLAGLPARQIYYDLYPVNPFYGGLLPADLDGPPPPPGTPNPFVQAADSTQVGPKDALLVWEFHVDWTDPSRSTFGLSGTPNRVLPVAGFTPLCQNNYSCIPQPGTSQRLDAISDRLMYRLQYRNFGAYAALVASHTVDDGSGRAGVRWYELRDDGGGWAVHQQGTHGGADPHHRWMGSAAMDRSGNLAIGYSASSETLYPSIRYAGRLAGDPPGVLAQGESTLIAGSGSQTNSYRWGDYSMLAVDPTDGCTFWFTSQYYLLTSSSEWRTHIGSFAFPSCTAGDTAKLQGTVTGADSGDPLVGAMVEVGGASTQTDTNGFYQFLNLQPGAHTIRVSKYGYASFTGGVEVSLDFVARQDVELAALPRTTVRGTVRDGSGQGWPLYARLLISALGDARAVYTSPATGGYQIDLVEGIPHTFSVLAVAAGYLEATRVITPTAGADPLDFELLVDPGDCTAPGYANTGSCTPRPGGLLLGHVQDENTGLGIDAAGVSRSGDPLESAVTTATPQDPQVGDGFYLLFSPPGEQSFMAAADHYGEDAFDAAVGAGTVISHTFDLPAGQLAAEPTGLGADLSLLKTETLVLTLRNRGGVAAAFDLSAVDAPLPDPQPTGPFASLTRHVSPKRLDDRAATAVYDYRPPEVPRLPGGRVYRTWASGLTFPWGIGFDPDRGDLWLGSLSPEGAARLQRFLADGSATVDTINLASQANAFFADMAYNPHARRFWQVAVGGHGCLVELDPAGKVLTGREICPGFDASQRGLAFNPLDGTFFSGSWNNGILYHFDASGRVLDSANIDLNISGLAFNPSTRHLFALTNADRGFDVYVLDAEDGYRVLGGFDIPGLEGFQQAGLEIDCAGRLWALNQETGSVIEADSGERLVCAWSEIPWLSLSPASGTIPPGGEQEIRISIEVRSAVSGVENVHLLVSNDTPYGPLIIPIKAVSRNEVILPIFMKLAGFLSK